jgi:hypothetical protein
VGEIEVDSRRRISLARLGLVQEHARYRVEEAGDGTLRLVPVASIPVRELEFWNDSELVEAMKRSLGQAARGEGEIVSFAEHLDSSTPEPT